MSNPSHPQVNLSRRKLLTAAGASVAAAAIPGAANAQSGPLVMSDFGGEWAAWNKKLFDTEFTKRTQHGLTRDAGADNAARIAKIKLGLPQKTYDIGCFADSFFARAEAEGLLKGVNLKSARLKNLKDVAPEFVNPKYVSHLYNGLGLGYNPKMVAKPPTSWADLWDPAYRGKIVLPTVNHSFGLHVMLFCGMVASGNMKDTNGALGRLRTLAAQQPIWALDSQAIMRSLSQGEAAIGWLGRGEHYQIAKGGGDIKFIMPREGGFATSWAFAPVTGTRFEQQVEDYIDVSLDPKLQAEYATHWGFHPTNKRWTEFADTETVKRIAFTADDTKHITPIDHGWFNSKRTELTEQWNRTVGA